MKRIMCALALLFIIALLCCGCNSHKGQVQIAGVWVNEENTKKYNFNMEQYEAEAKGDTYCKNCEKINPGKVRICKYCGKYV